jgi:hypothetical protein
MRFAAQKSSRYDVVVSAGRAMVAVAPIEATTMAAMPET